MKIVVVILHFGELVITKACIESLYKKETQPFSLLVVNNTQTKLYSKDFFPYKDIEVMNNSTNVGFAKGVNKGIMYARAHKADAVLLLNNDTQIIHPLLSILTSLLIAHPEVGAVAPAIAFKKGKDTLYDIGGSLIMPFAKTFHTEVKELSGISHRFVDYVSGCCMLIRVDVFKKVGLFDERFFLYYEDVDFCMRMRKEGLYSAVTPFAWIQHTLSASAGKVSSFAVYHQIRSLLLFGKKYYSNTFLRLPNLFFAFWQSVVFVKVAPLTIISVISAWKNAF